MTGKFNHGLDAKGRMTIPSQLRKELGEVCYLVRGPKPYLNVYSAEGWEKFCARFEGQTQTDSGDLLRFLFANAATCELDTQGRILIPAELREYAGIDKNVTIVGVPGRVEIWDAETYRASEETYFRQKSMAEIYKELGL